MKTLVRPLMKLTVISVLAFAPNALAYETCAQLCSERAPCDTGCYYWAMGPTTCGDAGFECWLGLSSAPVSMNEQPPTARMTGFTPYKRAPACGRVPKRT